MRKKILLGLLALVLVAGLYVYAHADEAGKAEFWESAIVDFEEADAVQPPGPGRIVFTGSSSIRFWGSLEEDMAPLSVLNRGFGGAHMAHVVHFADRIIAPYAPRALVVYVGDNDIAAGKTPETVVDDFEALVALARADRPTLPIYYITIKPSRSRWALWPTMAEANARIAARAAADPHMHVLDVATPMLALGQGEAPPSDLFWIDGLHLTEKGYALWTEVVRARLLADLGDL
ncbi:MAG: GDSL-type esterase/lipase family protein [Myxococcota bacterium]